MRDYMIRKDQAMAARSAASCEGCGHPHSEHRELAPTLAIVDGRLVEVENPDYRPLHFHCHVEGCDCVIVKS